MIALELPDDGFTTIMRGEVRLRINKTHVQCCVDAIRNRWANESQHVIEENNVVDLTYARKRGRVKS